MMKLTEEYTTWNQTVNVDKTKHLCISGEPNNLNLENEQKNCHCHDYVYLGVKFDSTGIDSKGDSKKNSTKTVINSLNSVLRIYIKKEIHIRNDG